MKIQGYYFQVIFNDGSIDVIFVEGNTLSEATHILKKRYYLIKTIINFERGEK